MEEKASVVWARHSLSLDTGYLGDVSALQGLGTPGPRGSRFGWSLSTWGMNSPPPRLARCQAELVHTASHWTVLPHSREGQTNKKAHRVLRGGEGCGGRPPRRAIQAAPEFRGREVLDPCSSYGDQRSERPR